MMRYAVFVAFVALALQASARRILPNGALYRRSIGDNEIDVSDEHKVRASWHRHADEGYPEFDGNPLKKLLASLTLDMTIYVMKDSEKTFRAADPPILKAIFKSALKNNWKNFDEYMDFWGAALIVMLKEAKKEYKRVTGEEFSNDNRRDDSSDFKSDAKRVLQWVSKFENYFAHDNVQSHEASYRHSIKDNVIDISDGFKLRAPWHADKGYPEFDGNPLKVLLAQGIAEASGKTLDIIEGLGASVPSDLKTILAGARETNWKNFDEYLEFWGRAVPALEEIIEKQK